WIDTHVVDRNYAVGEIIRVFDDLTQRQYIGEMICRLILERHKPFKQPNTTAWQLDREQAYQVHGRHHHAATKWDVPVSDLCFFPARLFLKPAACGIAVFVKTNR